MTCRTFILALFLVPVLLTPGCRRGRAGEIPQIAAAIPHGPIELRLMSFNIRYENPDDCASRSWPQRLRGIVRMIHEEKPDAFGIQEGLHGQVADLRASLPDYGFFGIGREDGDRAGEFAGIFYRLARIDADSADHGTFWLSDQPTRPGSSTWGNEVPRIAAWLRLIDRSTQRGFYVFNTHWDHQSQPARERSAQLLASRIDSRARSDEPLVFLGDFNAVAANPGIGYLLGKPVRLANQPARWHHALVETFETLHANQADRSTLHFWRGTRLGTLKVDHIFVSPGARVLDAAIRDNDQPMLSDHFPVTARVIFP